MDSVELKAPAKVNLFLKVLGKRPDSYHDILTIFERISLADTIRISRSAKGIRITSDVFITARPESNIMHKAACLMYKRLSIKDGVSIAIEKKIPIAAGLGGGSSDAAAVLRGMNRLFGCGLRPAELHLLAAELGADVPFFLMDAPYAIGRGRGDDLEPLALKTRLWHLLIYPGFRVLTRDVYQAFDAHCALPAGAHTRRAKGLTSASADDTIQPPFGTAMGYGALESALYNDLGRAAVRQNKVIGAIVRRLASSLGKKTMVSGSGPSIFCLYKSRKEVADAAKHLMSVVPGRARRDWRVFIVKTDM